MLRDGRTLRDMEHLIRTHYNCMLKTDRVRFKKSGPVSRPIDEEQAGMNGNEIVDNEHQPAISSQQFLSTYPTGNSISSEYKGSHHLPTVLALFNSRQYKPNGAQQRRPYYQLVGLRLRPTIQDDYIDNDRR